MNSNKLTSVNVPVIPGKVTSRLRLDKKTDIGNTYTSGNIVSDDTPCLFSFNNVGSTQFSFSLKSTHGTNPSSTRSDLIPFIALVPGGYHAQEATLTGEFLEVTGGTGSGNLRMEISADGHFILTNPSKDEPFYPSSIEYPI